MNPSMALLLMQELEKENDLKFSLLIVIKMAKKIFF